MLHAPHVINRGHHNKLFVYEGDDDVWFLKLRNGLDYEFESESESEGESESQAYDDHSHYSFLGINKHK